MIIFHRYFYACSDIVNLTGGPSTRKLVMKLKVASISNKGLFNQWFLFNIYSEGIYHINLESLV